MFEKSPLKNLFANNNFRYLYVAGLTSELGSFVTDTAIMLFVFALSGQNKTYLGTIRVLFLVCFTAGSLLGGPLGVRFNKRSLLLVSEICRIPLILSLMYFHQIHFVMLANALIGLFTGMYNPSRQALINEVVPEKDIQNANSLFGSTMAVLHMAGPFIGATLYSINKGIFEVLFLDLATYIIGIYLLLRISTVVKIQTKQFGHPFEDFWHDFKEGFNYVLSRFDLTAMLAYTIVMGFSIGVLIPLLIPFVSEVLQKGDREYGIVLSLFGFGGIAGGYLSHFLGQRYKAVNLFLIGIFSEAILMPIWIRTTNFYLSCFIFFIWGILVFIRIPAQLNYISATVPKEYMTRVHSFLDLVFVVPNISAGLSVAIIGGHLSTFQVLNYTSIMFIILTIAGLFSKRTKALIHASEQ